MKETRPLWNRAKFMLPLCCAMLATGLAVLGVLLIALTANGGAQAGHIGGILGTALAVLGALGTVGAGAQGFHDTLRDMGAGKAFAAKTGDMSIQGEGS